MKIGAVNQTEKDYHDGNVGHRCVSKDVHVIPKAWTKGHHPQKVKTTHLFSKGQITISKW